jgi:membrane protein YdbS with pleckstrin-like domain
MNARAWAHALIAAPAGAVLGAIVLTIWGFGGRDLTAAQAAGAVAALGIYGTLLALPAVFLYGVPLYAVLDRLGVANGITALACGALPGVAWVTWTHSPWVDPVLIDGVLIAVVYVLLRRRNP